MDWNYLESPHRPGFNVPWDQPGETIPEVAASLPENHG
jgi:hypothetical protein